MYIHLKLYKCFHAGESRNRCFILICFVYIIVIHSNIAVSLAIDYLFILHFRIEMKLIKGEKDDKDYQDLIMFCFWIYYKMTIIIHCTTSMY